MKIVHKKFSLILFVLLALIFILFFVRESINKVNSSQNIISQSSSNLIKKTDPADAHILLENIANAFIIHSLKFGSGGKQNFASQLETVSDYVMQEIRETILAPQNEPFRGYRIKILEYSKGDNFQTNFKIVAEPATGYTGKKYLIDKSKEIIEF